MGKGKGKRAGGDTSRKGKRARVVDVAEGEWWVVGGGWVVFVRLDRYVCVCVCLFSLFGRGQLWTTVNALQLQPSAEGWLLVIKGG